MILMPELCYYCREELNFGDMTLHDGHRVHKKCLPPINEFKQAARKAAEEINDILFMNVCDETRKIITKHVAEIEAVFGKLVLLAIATEAHIKADGNDGIFVVEELLNDPQVKAAMERSKE